jgi:DNA replication protein DnaC
MDTANLLDPVAYMMPCTEHHTDRFAGCERCRDDLFETRDSAGLIKWGALRNAADAYERMPRRFRDALADHPDLLAWADVWKRNAETAPSLLITGTIGVGKTHQSYGVLRSVIATARIGKYLTRIHVPTWEAIGAADMYASMRPRNGVDTEAVMDRYRNVDVLMLDDLGAAKASEWVEEVTYRIISGRYDDMRSSIYTSNVPKDQIKHVLGDRIASRLAETCQIVTMTGPDRRRVAVS